MNGNRQKVPLVTLPALVLALALLTQTVYGQAGPIDPLFNEFNHTGTDTHEYVEIRGDPGTDYSAFTILEIEGDGSGAGVIDGVLAVGTTNTGDYWTTSFLNNEFENGTVTLLLVEGFTGSDGDNLDTDNDGVLDTAPSTRIVDDVAIADGGADDRAYASTVLSGGFDGVSFTPGGASCIPDGIDTGTVGDWMRNDFDGEGLPGFTGTPVVGEALNTPGAANQAVSVLPGNLVINEIDYDQPSTDVAEFVEIKHKGDSSVNLDLYTLELVNGSTSTVYGAIDLPDVELAAGAYYVVCGNAANVPNCDLDLSPDSNLIQNEAPDAVVLLFDGTIVDTVSYQGDTAAPYTEGSGVGLTDDPGLDDRGISRCPDGADTDQNNADLRYLDITPGAENACDACGGPASLIHDVQGAGDAGSMAGATVVVEAVVVADFQASGGLVGFFLQEEDTDIDAERDGKGNGRVYHVQFTADDVHGACSGELLVSVPLNKVDDAVDDDPLYDSTLE